MNKEIMEVQKEDIEKEIKELNACALKIEELKELMPVNSLSNFKLSAFVNEIEKEIEYSDFILQELNESIDFEDRKK